MTYELKEFQAKCDQLSNKIIDIAKDGYDHNILISVCGELILKIIQNHSVKCPDETLENYIKTLRVNNEILKKAKESSDE